MILDNFFKNLIYDPVSVLGLLVFYFFNKTPAKVFMGDIGSTFLGALLCLEIISARNLKQLKPSLDSVKISLDNETYKLISNISPTPAPATDRLEEVSEN